MEELESQIAKIVLGNTKSSSSYVFVLAEPANAANTELYAVAELPMLSPAAEESCERICLAIASALRRAYKNPGGADNFENAVNQVNEELGKLASMGQTEWISKLNCALAVKQGQHFNLATTGKIAAYMLRGGEFTDIGCSSTQSHPLKTFENYSTGKIRLDDVLVLSTTQLFNYLSMDRLLSIISNSNFLTAAQTLIALLKQNADPQVSFGVLLNLQVPMGQASEQQADLEDYVVEAPAKTDNLPARAFSYLKTAFAVHKNQAREPKTELPKVSLGQSLKNFSGNTKQLLDKSKNFWATAKTSANTVRTSVNLKNIQGYSTQKKFFLASALICLIAVIANVSIASHLKKVRQTESQIGSSIQQAQNLLANAQSLLLYKDDSQASAYLEQAKAALPQASAVPPNQKANYQKALAEIQTINQQLQKVVQPTVANLGSLGSGNVLISLPNFLATKSGQSVISYNTQTTQIQDGALTLPVNVVALVYVGGNNAIVYDGTSLYVWDFVAGKLGPGFNQNVPPKTDFAGMAYYATNHRVYVADKNAGMVVSFLIGKSSLSKPVVAVKDPSINQATGLAIDGNVYVLTPSGINKFLGGHPVNFNLPVLSPPLPTIGEIYTDKTAGSIYLLDSQNRRILVFDKTGNLSYSLQSDQFTKPMDFAVNETDKIIYLLNDGNLLKVSLP